MKLETMGAFFEARLDGYEEHMLSNNKALKNAGFGSVVILKNWGATYTLKARV